MDRPPRSRPRSRSRSRSRAALTLVAAALASGLVGCAPALPSPIGGRTTPRGRTDLALGGAVRVPVGDLVAQPGAVTEDVLLAAAAPGGAVPLAEVRHGLTDAVDLDVQVAGATLRVGARGRLRLGTASLMGSIVPHAGIVDPSVSAGRVGAALPLAVGIELFSVVEAWLGARVAVDHVFGETADGASLSVLGVRTGGFLGVAVGFRRFHAFVALGVDHELWTGSLDDTSIERQGASLTPSFGLRLRL